MKKLLVAIAIVTFSASAFAAHLENLASKPKPFFGEKALAAKGDVLAVRAEAKSASDAVLSHANPIKSVAKAPAASAPVKAAKKSSKKGFPWATVVTGALFGGMAGALSGGLLGFFLMGAFAAAFGYLLQKHVF